MYEGDFLPPATLTVRPKNKKINVKVFLLNYTEQEKKLYSYFIWSDLQEILGK